MPSLIDPENYEALQLALSLVGKPLRFAHQVGGESRRIECVGVTGMVSIVGMSGEFAPHLFRVNNSYPIEKAS